MEVKLSGLVKVLDLELFAKILEKDLPPGQTVFLFLATWSTNVSSNAVPRKDVA